MLADRPPHWVESFGKGVGPIYLALVEALEAAVRTGELQPGEQLPPQRTLARWLGIDFTTVTRAYAAARVRGLVEGTAGRGTFVRARAAEDEAGLVDLSMNLPPPPEGLSLGGLIAETAAAILGRSDPASLMAYHPGAGAIGQRAAGAAWLQPCLGKLSPDRVLVAAGAQTALAAALGAVCKPGDMVVVEPLTYPGLMAAAGLLGLRLIACETDEQGVRPDSLDRLCAEALPSALYLVPTMQNPVASTMGEARRAAVAAVAQRRGLWVVEDDPYSRLMAEPPPALARFAPDRTIHVATLSKCLTPGLRVAFVVPPEGAVAERMAQSLRAISLMPAPLMAAIAAAWIREGVADTLLAAVRKEARARRQLAADRLPQARGAAEGVHIWLPQIDGPRADRLRAAAQGRGLALVTAEAFAVHADHPHGVRISLGGPTSRKVLDAALASIADLLVGPGPAGRLVV